MGETRMHLIGVALGVPTMAEAIRELPALQSRADAVELRLDLLQEPLDLPRLLAARGRLPAIVTLRSREQGGACDAPAAERFEVLLDAARHGAEYVDLEWDAATPQCLAALRAAGSQVILSRHDFSGMPVDLADWWQQIADLGPDVVKVVGTAHEVRDCQSVFAAFEQAHLPTVAIAMGEPGLPSRILALREEQCFLTYAAPDSTAGTAPGQVPLSDMRDVYHAERLRATTRVFGLLGGHVERDRLKQYNDWFATAGIDAVAVPFVATSDAPSIVSAFTTGPLAVSGWHVHGAELQETVGQCLDDLSGAACRIGKINAIVQHADGTLRGDWVGSPAEQYAQWIGSAPPRT